MLSDRTGMLAGSGMAVVCGEGACLLFRAIADWASREPQGCKCILGRVRANFLLVRFHELAERFVRCRSDGAEHASW